MCACVRVRAQVCRCAWVTLPAARRFTRFVGVAEMRPDVRCPERAVHLCFVCVFVCGVAAGSQNTCTHTRTHARTHRRREHIRTYAHTRTGAQVPCTRTNIRKSARVTREIVRRSGRNGKETQREPRETRTEGGPDNSTSAPLTPQSAHTRAHAPARRK